MPAAHAPRRANDAMLERAGYTSGKLVLIADLSKRRLERQAYLNGYNKENSD